MAIGIAIVIDVVINAMASDSHIICVCAAVSVIFVAVVIIIQSLLLSQLFLPLLHLIV